MARLSNKGTQLQASAVCGQFLTDCVSKAGLADLYLQALQLLSDNPSEPVTLQQLQEDADPTLRLRGDRTISQHVARYRRGGFKLPGD